MRWSAENPAKIWGLYPRKGTLTVGSDADIAIVDINRELDHRRRPDPVALENLALAGPQGHRTADPHHRARPLRDEGPVLQENARGSGRSVHAIQQMPPAKPRNTDTTMAAITAAQKG